MNIIEKNGLPNIYTKGEVGDIYIDTTTGFKYKCESIITIGESDTIRTIYNWYGIREDYKGEADKYKQQSDLYESVLIGEVTNFVMPDRWTEIRRGAFNACTKLTNVTLSNNLTIIGVTAFNFCSSLESINIPDGVIEIRDNAFYGCTSLINMTISNTVTKLGRSIFTNCSNLTNVTLGNGFNCDHLDLSASIKYSVDTLVAMFTALADRTGQTAYTLTLGTTNLEKLTEAQKAIATDKNWTLA